VEADPQHRGIFSNREKDREEKGDPLESATPTTHCGVLHAHSANRNRCANIGQSERYNLHNPTDQCNLEGSEEEIPLEGEEL
jgi:hypothetical protein